MHNVALLAVHDGERERARLLVFAFLGQLDQLGEPLVNHLDEGGVLFGERPQELRVVGLQLGGQVRVADLEADRQAPVALQRAALVAALQGLVAFGFAGAENVAQFDGASALHLLHGGGELRGCDPSVLFAEVVTGSGLLAVAALARHFDGFATREILRAVALVAGGFALVGAAGACCRAGLAADFALGLASVLVTWFDAAVAGAGKWFGACKSAAERGLVAGDGFALFVLAVAGLGGEDDAGWTVRVGMTVVEDGVRARVLAGAGLAAGRFGRSARDRREDDGGATLAGQFVEGHAVASWA